MYWNDFVRARLRETRVRKARFILPSSKPLKKMRFYISKSVYYLRLSRRRSINHWIFSQHHLHFLNILTRRSNANLRKPRCHFVVHLLGITHSYNILLQVYAVQIHCKIFTSFTSLPVDNGQARTL